MGHEKYPEGLVEKITSKFPNTLLVDGLKLAADAGNPKTANTVLLGAVSKRLDIAEEFWLKALERMVPAKAVDVNIKAFNLGRAL